METTTVIRYTCQIGNGYIDIVKIGNSTFKAVDYFQRNNAGFYQRHNIIKFDSKRIPAEETFTTFDDAKASAIRYANSVVPAAGHIAGNTIEVL